MWPSRFAPHGCCTGANGDGQGPGCSCPAVRPESGWPCQPHQDYRRHGGTGKWTWQGHQFFAVSGVCGGQKCWPAACLCPCFVSRCPGCLLSFMHATAAQHSPAGGRYQASISICPCNCMVFQVPATAGCFNAWLRSNFHWRTLYPTNTATMLVLVHSQKPGACMPLPERLPGLPHSASMQAALQQDHLLINAMQLRISGTSWYPKTGALMDTTSMAMCTEEIIRVSL